MKRMTLAIFATLLTMASTTFAATQAANQATISPTLQISATVQKAVSLTLATGATAGVGHCAVSPQAGNPDFSMNLGTVDALGINQTGCQNVIKPTQPGVDNAIYWTDYQITPIFTSHQTFSTTTVTAQVTSDFAAPNNLQVVRDNSSSNAATVTTPSAASNFVVVSTSTGDTIGASGVASGTALTRFIGVAVKPLNLNSVSYAQQTATVTFTLTVQ